MSSFRTLEGYSGIDALAPNRCEISVAAFDQLSIVQPGEGVVEGNGGDG